MPESTQLEPEREKDSEELELEDLVFGGLRENVVNQAIAQAGLSNTLGYAIDSTPSLDTPAWHDDDDELVDIQSRKRLRKLKTEFEETSISTTQYEQRLRTQYQKLMPTPKWAEVGEEAEGSSLLMSQGGIVKQPALNPDKLDMLRVKDANQEAISRVYLLISVLCRMCNFILFCPSCSLAATTRRFVCSRLTARTTPSCRALF
jgi:hypothetical protein